VVIDETDGHTGLGADAADGHALVAVHLQAAQRRLDQRLAPHGRRRAVKFWLEFLAGVLHVGDGLGSA
jgi:hypothetical protein